MFYLWVMYYTRISQHWPWMHFALLFIMLDKTYWEKFILLCAIFLVLVPKWYLHQYCVIAVQSNFIALTFCALLYWVWIYLRKNFVICNKTLWKCENRWFSSSCGNLHKYMHLWLGKWFIIHYMYIQIMGIKIHRILIIKVF